MRFNYKNNDYILFELKEPNKNNTYDIISIFRVHTFIMKGFDKIKEISQKEARAEEENIYKKGLSILETYEYINYFYGVEDPKEMINNAIAYIKQ